MSDTPTPLTDEQLRAEITELMDDATGLIDQYDYRDDYVNRLIALFHQALAAREVMARKEGFYAGCGVGDWPIEKVEQAWKLYVSALQQSSKEGES